MSGITFSTRRINDPGMPVAGLGVRFPQWTTLYEDEQAMRLPDSPTGISLYDMRHEITARNIRMGAVDNFIREIVKTNARGGVIVAPSVRHVWDQILYPLMKTEHRALAASVGSSEFKLFGQTILIQASDSTSPFGYGLGNPALVFGESLRDAIWKLKGSPVIPFDYRLFDSESVKTVEEASFLMELHDARTLAPRAAHEASEGLPEGIRKMLSLPTENDYPPNSEELLRITARVAHLLTT